MTAPTPMLDALFYLADHGEQQTFRVAEATGLHAARGGGTKGTDTARNYLQKLQRRGLVTSRKRWPGGPFFWQLTDTGRKFVEETRGR